MGLGLGLGQMLARLGGKIGVSGCASGAWLLDRSLGAEGNVNQEMVTVKLRAHLAHVCIRTKHHAALEVAARLGIPLIRHDVNRAMVLDRQC